MNSLLDNIIKYTSVKMYVFAYSALRLPYIFRSSSDHPPGAYVKEPCIKNRWIIK